MRKKGEDRTDLSIDEFYGIKSWYNILPDLPEPLPPPKEPGDGTSRIKFMQRVMSRTCFSQESSSKSRIPIPDEVMKLYVQAGRPRPLYRARRLEKYLKLKNVKLYYKREDLSPTGSHKVNTAIAQTFFAWKEGKTKLVTETGAGQWGTALSYAAKLLGLDCIVFWVRAVYKWKTDRSTLMKLYGATVYPSPSDQTETGRRLLRENADHPGSLGIAVSEGLEYAEKQEQSVYCLGSVLNHVLMHQTIIGLEAIKQFESIDESPDLMIGCLGGGSNFGGFILPFAGEVLQKKRTCEFLAAQSMAAPNLVKGQYKYDFADVSEHTPLLKMYTLGHKVEMPTMKADGLRYHAAAPIISLLRYHGVVKARAYATDEKEIFEAARIFLNTEGWLAAPESSYAIRAAIDAAREFEKRKEGKAIAFNISGHGFLDLPAYKEKLFAS